MTQDALAQARKALKVFAKIADIEDAAGTPDGATVMVNVSRCRDARSTLSAIDAALEGGAVPKVKALEWRDLYVVENRPGDLVANTILGAYRTRPNVNGGFRLYCVNGPATRFDTIEDAKSAAQADYEQRILSALDLPELRAKLETVRAETLEEAALAGWNACRRSIYAVCEDMQEKPYADPEGLKGSTEMQIEHGRGFNRGWSYAAKSIARGFNSMEAVDDDNFATAIRSLNKDQQND